MQLGVHPSVHVAGVFSSPENVRFFCFHRFGHAGLAFDLRTGWDLNDPAQRAKLWSHLQHERPILIVGSWSGHSAGTSHMRWMMDTFLWQVAQGRFFAHQHSGNVPRNADNCAMKSILVSCVDCWRTFITSCEEMHNNLSVGELHCCDDTRVEASIDSNWLFAGIWIWTCSGRTLSCRNCRLRSRVVRWNRCIASF